MNATLRRIGPRFILAAGACWLIATGSIYIYGVHVGLAAFTPQYRALPFLDAWIRWDARWYETIALHGYSFSERAQSSVAFFPLYPLLMRAFGWLGVGPLIAGIFITLASGLVAACLFYRWAAGRSDQPTATTATWLLLLWPFGFFLYGAVYADALFLALVIGAFLCIEEKRVWTAAFLGALATATRPVGPAVILGLLLRQMEIRWRSRTPLRAMDFTPILSAVGLLSYMAFQYWKFGTPFAFLDTQIGWQQDPGWHVWLKLDFFRSPEFATKMPLALLHAALSLTCIALAIPTWRRFGAAYAVYVLLVVGLPFISSKEFIGLGRYALAAFPCFLTAASLLANRPRARLLWFAASAALLVVQTSKFAVGRYVS
jgi:Gpi18-like mannosyltransferase